MMKISMSNITLEVQKLVVEPAQERRTRARRAAAGWTLQSTSVREDGKVELVFERRNLGTIEVTP